MSGFWGRWMGYSLGVVEQCIISRATTLRRNENYPNVSRKAAKSQSRDEHFPYQCQYLWLSVRQSVVSVVKKQEFMRYEFYCLAPSRKAAKPYVPSLFMFQMRADSPGFQGRQVRQDGSA